jgi:small-conductance mechanosensitive channel
MKFGRSLLLIIGISVITYTYLNQFEASKDTSKTLLQSGSLIIALATFSCQKFLGNIVSVIMLSTTKPFDIGDKITLINTGGNIVVEGTIKSMNIRHVVFQKPDGKVDYVANSIVDECVIENSNVSDDNGRIFIIECTYDSNIDVAINIVRDEINRCPFTIDKDINEFPSAKIRCSNLNPNGYEIKTCIWADNINSSFDAFDWLNRNIPSAWEKQGIHMPYETITIERKSYEKEN